MTDEDTATAAAEPGKSTADANYTSARRTGSPGSDKDPVVGSLLERLLWSDREPLPLSADQKFMANLRKVANFAHGDSWTMMTPTAVALDPEPRRKFYEEVARDLGPLLVEALMESNRLSAAARVMDVIRPALSPRKRGRPDAWTTENRSRVFIDLFSQVLKNPKLSATEAWKKVAEDEFWRKHAVRMGSKGPVYRHVQEGAKGIGKDLGQPIAKDAADMTRMINAWRTRALTDPDWRNEQIEKVRRYRASRGDANSRTA